MSWHKLNNSELQAMRKLLMLDVSEAAELIGKVSQRTWQYWESGRSPVPDDVDAEIYGLIQMRNDIIHDLTETQVKSELSDKPDELKMHYYHTFEQFESEHAGKNKVDWRVHQAAVSFVFSEGGDVELN